MSRSRTTGSGLSRREFLTGATLGAAGLAAGSLGCAGSSWEGIYTDRFTYRQGEPIQVFGSLSSGLAVDIDLLRRDGATHAERGLRERIGVVFPRCGNEFLAGIYGARMPWVASFDTTSLVPGIYSVKLPLAAMEPQNQKNLYNGFPSSNNEVVFAVTNPDPGEHSRLLWLHDSLTGTAYGSFGGQSIYGDHTVRVNTVSQSRPGLARSTTWWLPLRFLQQNGYEFECLDLAELDRLPASFLEAYDLVLWIGQFEYVPHGVMAKLEAFLADGGNLFCASNEPAIFRVRLDLDSPAQSVKKFRQLTTYKTNFEAEDPLWGSGSPEVAGVGMNIPETVWESEILGQTLWAAHRVADGAWASMALHRASEAGWIWDGTGATTLPDAFMDFGTGNLIEFDMAGEPFTVDHQLTRTPPDTVVWATTPSADAREWWNANGQEIRFWPTFDGYATATYQQRGSGSQVVTLPSSNLVTEHLDDPLYQRIILNIMDRLGS